MVNQGNPETLIRENLMSSGSRGLVSLFPPKLGLVRERAPD
jgi:hypothetical protein